MNRRSTHLLLTALAVPALLTACGESTSGTPASGPTSSSAGSPEALGTAVLLTDADTVYSDGADWFRTAAGEGEGTTPPNPCAAEGLAASGATSIVRADFELRNTADPEVTVDGDALVEVVAAYADAAAATRAWSLVGSWLEECDARPEALTEYRSLQTRKVAVDGADAVITDSHLGPVPAALDPFGEAAYIMETGIAVEGTHLVVLTSVIVGQDYNFLPEDGGTPVEQMLPVALARLG